MTFRLKGHSKNQFDPFFTKSTWGWLNTDHHINIIPREAIKKLAENSITFTLLIGNDYF